MMLEQLQHDEKYQGIMMQREKGSDSDTDNSLLKFLDPTRDLVEEERL